MTVHSPAAAMRALSRHLRTGAALDDEVRAFLADGVDEFLASSGDVPLDRTLGLSRRPGQRSAGTVRMLERRVGLVRQAATDHFPGLKPSAAAHRIFRAWSRYASSSWPRERSSAGVPLHRAGKPEGMFWQLMALQDRVLSERSIRQILAGS